MEIVEKYLNKEFGSFKVTEYLGYYCHGQSKYRRHYFKKVCVFCNRESNNTPGSLNDLMSRDNPTCPYCKGVINVHSNEKKCKRCEVWYPATSEYFVKSKSRRFGIHYYCKKCSLEKHRKLREDEDYRKKEYKGVLDREKRDPLFKLSRRIRVQIKNYMKINNVKKTKNCSSTKILGCSFLQFKEHIEKQFIDGMSWDNYGEWHYEHIIPISLGKTFDEVRELCHHTNYRPLWGIENSSKGNKIIMDIISEENKIRYKKFLDRV